jgi:hypothetical protein
MIDEQQNSKKQQWANEIENTDAISAYHEPDIAQNAKES